MVNKIYELKNKLLDYAEQCIREKGIERLDGELVDMVKDLAEAEKCCWEADYYRTAVESMEGKDGYSGYMPEGMGYTRRNMRRGYNGQYGYDGVGEVHRMIDSASPEKLEQIKQMLR